MNRTATVFCSVFLCLALDVTAGQTGKTSTQVNVADPQKPTTSKQQNTSVPSEADCHHYVTEAVSAQWQKLGDRILEELNKCKAFSPELKTRLSEGEKNLSPAARYYLRLSVLTQLAQR